jgi:hypothetical protein
LCHEYLTQRYKGNHEKANFVILEMIDQLVRKEPGGELGALYRSIRSNKQEHNSLIPYIYSRTGEDLDKTINGKKNIVGRINFDKVKNLLSEHYCKLVSLLFPSAFRKQNVSYAQVGEKHAWLYDFHTLSRELYSIGFSKVERMTYSTSYIHNFPFNPLDVNDDNMPRKGQESMYIEAIK